MNWNKNACAMLLAETYEVGAGLGKLKKCVFALEMGMTGAAGPVLGHELVTSLTAHLLKSRNHRS